MFTVPELEEIRTLAYDKRADLEQHIETMGQISEALGRGELVMMFAPGDAGIRAARDMTATFKARIERVTAIIEKTERELGFSE